MPEQPNLWDNGLATLRRARTNLGYGLGGVGQMVGAGANYVGQGARAGMLGASRAVLAPIATMLDGQVPGAAPYQQPSPQNVPSAGISSQGIGISTGSHGQGGTEVKPSGLLGNALASLAGFPGVPPTGAAAVPAAAAGRTMFGQAVPNPAFPTQSMLGAQNWMAGAQGLMNQTRGLAGGMGYGTGGPGDPNVGATANLSAIYGGPGPYSDPTRAAQAAAQGRMRAAQAQAGGALQAEILKGTFGLEEARQSQAAKRSQLQLLLEAIQGTQNPDAANALATLLAG